MDWLRAYFQFHTIERNGVVVLLFLLAGIVALNLGLRYFPPDHKPNAELVILTDSLAKELEVEQDNYPSIKQTNRRDSLFNFDPNALDSAGWVALGFSPKQTRVVLKFRDRSGGFRDTAHMARMGMIHERMADLGPYIQFDPATMPAAKARYPTTTYPPKVFEKKEWPKLRVNVADSVEWTKLPGIGEVFASKIIRYRKRLGGFHSLGQLMEVKGMDSTRMALIGPRIELGNDPVQPIRINFATVEELGPHPYIGWKLAKIIVAYRQQHGPFRTVDDLKQIHLVTDEGVRKLAPYISLQ